MKSSQVNAYEDLSVPWQLTGGIVEMTLPACSSLRTVSVTTNFSNQPVLTADVLEAEGPLDGPCLRTHVRRFINGTDATYVDSRTLHAPVGPIIQTAP
jgi:hypothetical protein